MKKLLEVHVVVDRDSNVDQRRRGQRRRRRRRIGENDGAESMMTKPAAFLSLAEIPRNSDSELTDLILADLLFALAGAQTLRHGFYIPR